MKKTLSLEEAKRLLALTSASERKGGHSENRALFLAVLLCGAPARSWTWEDALSDVINMPFAVYYALRNMACDKHLSIFPFNHSKFTDAHWVRGARLQNAVFTRTGKKALTTQEVTRRLKVYARRAGIKPALVSLRTLANTHQSFFNLYGDADRVAELLGIADPIVTTVTGRTPPAGTSLTAGKKKQPAGVSVESLILSASVRVERDPRLHGLHRRSAMKTG